MKHLCCINVENGCLNDVGVSMAVEVFMFVKNNTRNEMDARKWMHVMTLQLTLEHLNQALFYNPTLKRLLPLLMTVQLNSIAGDIESPAIQNEYLHNHLFNEDCLLWLSLTGREDITKDKLNDRLHTFFALHHLYRSYQYNYSPMNSANLVFFNIRDLEQYLQLPISASQVTDLLSTTSTVLNNTRLLACLPSPLKELSL